MTVADLLNLKASRQISLLKIEDYLFQYFYYAL